jgi:hypothetical protein
VGEIKAYEKLPFGGRTHCGISDRSVLELAQFTPTENLECCEQGDMEIENRLEANLDMNEFSHPFATPQKLLHQLQPICTERDRWEIESQQLANKLGLSLTPAFVAEGAAMKTWCADTTDFLETGIKLGAREESGQTVAPGEENRTILSKKAHRSNVDRRAMLEAMAANDAARDGTAR